MASVSDYEKQLLGLREQYVERQDAVHADTHHQHEPVEKDFAEQVSQRENDDVLEALEEDARQIVMKIDSALIRIKSGEFGLCRYCGRKIPDARLDIIPYAEYCIDCAEDLASRG